MIPGHPEVIGVAVLFVVYVVITVTAGVRQDRRVNRQLWMEYVAAQRAGQNPRLPGPGVVVVRVMADRPEPAAIEAPRRDQDGGVAA